MKDNRSRPFPWRMALFAWLPVLLFGGPRVAELPLSFEPNLGQSVPGVRFLARVPGQQVYLDTRGVTTVLAGNHAAATLRFEFAGAEPDAAITGEGPLSGRSHYLKGSPRNWIRNVPTWARVRLTGIYPGIDAVYHGNRGQLEYDLVIAPLADPSMIRLAFRGVRPSIGPSGDLIIPTAAGPVRQHPPRATQTVDGIRRPVEAAYRLNGDGTVGFRLGEYDRERGVVIDPVVSFATFLGGTGLEEGNAVAVDAQGNIYIAGGTESADFPTTSGTFQPENASTRLPGDAFVTKLTPDGSSVIYSTYIGGDQSDLAYALAVNAAGEVFLAGETTSSRFPASFGAFQIFNSSIGVYPEGFVTRLSADGSSLVYSTYLGDDLSDRVYAIAVDPQDNAYIAGTTNSPQFPSRGNAFQKTCPSDGAAGFVAKVAPDGATLPFATRLCGSGNDAALTVALDETGAVYVGGVTDSTDFPVTAGAWQTAGGGVQQDGFVAKLSPDGSTLVYGTYLGGSDNDAVTGIAVNGQGNAYVTGFTASPDFPVTAGALQTSHGDAGTANDAFVAELNSAGSGFAYSTFLGGRGDDQATAIALGSGGTAHVTGFSSSPDFPVTPENCQTGFGGGRDAFAARLSGSGSALDYSFYLGGREDEEGAAVAVAPDGSTVIAGRTSSSNFTTTPGAFRTAYRSGYQGASDAFVARISEGGAPSLPCVSLNGLVNGASFLPGSVSPGEIVSVFGAGLGPDTPATFDLDGGDTIKPELAGTTVLFDGVPAPIISASTGQVNAIVPYAVTGRQSTTVQVDYLGKRTGALVIPVSGTSPAIFTIGSSGRGPGAILNQNFSVNTRDDRAEKGSIVQIFATGEGQTAPPGIDGKLAVGSLPAPLLGVTVTIGGLNALVKYAGAAPGLVAGLIQINAEIPQNVASGSAVPVTITIGGRTCPPGVTLAIR